MERIWIFEGKVGKTFPQEKKLLVEELKSAFKIEDKPSSKTSLAISLAGDGSLLSMLRNLGELRHQVPILGIHTSAGLGFLHRLALPQTGPKDTKQWAKRFVKMLKNQEYSIQKRWGIEATIGRNNSCWGMNDLVISKGSLSRMVSLKVSVNGSVLFAKLRGDGLIVATPVGSTAYSLAAGGPIVVPGLDGLLLTPILPHEIAQRPVILTSDSEIEIKVLEGPPSYLTEDGQRTTELRAGQTLCIRRAEDAVHWLAPDMEGVRDYFEILRSKLGLGGGLLNSKEG
ncbi:MAG: NAD(+)/NADH kinase [Bdellovibrionota bacterium]